MRIFAFALIAAAAACIAGAEEYEEFNILRFVEVRSKQLRDLCPSGIDRCHCMFQNGTFVKDNLYFEDGPIEAGILHATCNPDFCYCKDSPDVERDARSQEMRVVMDVCPRNEMSRCLCQDKSVAQFPFDLTTFFQTCKPNRCKCKNDKKVKKVTGFGCAKGGFPWCPNTVDHKYFCKNGDTVFLEDLAQYVIQGRSGCICRDGIEPRCKETGDVVVCPDGSYVDRSIGNPGAYYEGCSNEPWDF